MNQIFTSTPHWKFTTPDRIAEIHFSALQQLTIKQLPPSFYSGRTNTYSAKTLTHLKQVQETRLYKLLKTIPKGALHHIHGPCCDDPKYVDCS